MILMYKIMLIILLFSITLYANKAHYVGDKECISCHVKENHEWVGSHHDQAMMVADEYSVKADFNNTIFNYNGIISKFYKKNGKFMVETDGPDGKLHKYEIAYTFGIYPLQQYMIKFPDGKIQVLDPTWDNRSKAEGGQRWYHIHQDDNVTAGDPLHWTGPNMNWNYMCADCHSTNIKKNYDAESKSYNTTWALINVSCEACHGPASEHLLWSKKQKTSVKNKGFTQNFQTSTKPWRERSATLKAMMQKQELNVCAKCHSRRTQVSDDFKAGDKFSDHYLNVTLAENLYFSDGKIKDEVYVYNSFLQSKMYEEGVTCSDCHNVHSLKRKGVGDSVCFSCHTQAMYENKIHTKHENNEAGCISCHMPSRIYMGVDERNDHSFRIPRPDLSVNSKIPNACNNCHKDKSASWADKAMKKWYKNTPIGKQNFSHDLSNLRKNSKYAGDSLYKILLGTSPQIAKVTAITYLGRFPSKQTYTTTMQLLRNKVPAIRLAALKALESFPVKLRVRETFKLLDDKEMPVRIEAARQLSFIDRGELDDATSLKLKTAIAEYEKTLLFNADRAESQTALATLYTNLKEYSKAETAYIEALRIQKKYVPAYVNYASFLHKSRRDKEAYTLLTKGLEELGDSAALHHSLGLYYTRHKENIKALESLKIAANLEKNNEIYQYVYAVALSRTDIKKAINILQDSLAKYTGDLKILYALAYYYKKIGSNEQAKIYQEQADRIADFIIDTTN